MTKRFGFTLAEGATHVGICDNARREAFTLAEVLITLGIIGVVAAMTIPTLISNTNGAQFKTAYKKALSTLNQGVLMNVALKDTDFSSLEAETVAGNAVVAGDESSSTMASILDRNVRLMDNVTKGYFTEKDTDGTTIKYPSFKVTIKHTCGESDTTTGCSTDNVGKEIDKEETIQTDANWAVFSIQDGTAFGYNTRATNCSGKTTACVGFIDANGTTTPNKVTESADSISDVFPVFFYGQTVEPATEAARAVLFGK